MQYTTLPGTSVKVSRICLGTMTYGEQNTEHQAHQQLDYATGEGVNFIDTAEMYPVPRNAQTCGRTETYIGTWLKKRKDRSRLVIATKIAGPDSSLGHIRDPLNFTPGQIRTAIDGSLKRLQTDYIDLYQLHWPERRTNRFGIRYFPSHAEDRWKDNFLEVLHCLGEQIKEGKIRYTGVSNETPWGLMHFHHLAKIYRLPRMITIQNAYNMLNRTFEYGLSEVCTRENTGLLAYSPLGFGMLTGKYHQGVYPEKSRLKLFPQLSRYSSENSCSATAAFLKIAEKNGLSLALMALAYVSSKPFVTSSIIGVTTLDQLKEDIAGINIILDAVVIKEIEEVMTKYPDPAP